MRKKDFMLGLGIGMVFATAIMMVPDSSQDKMTDAEVKERALELGMIEREDALDQVLSTQATATDEPKGSEKPEVTEEAMASTSPSATSATNKASSTNRKPAGTKTTPTEEVSETEKPKVTDAPKTTKKPSKNEQVSYVTLEIKAGMWSEEIASTLYSLELVDNADAFDKFLCDNGYGSMIKVGTYKIPTNATYTEIAEIITK